MKQQVRNKLHGKAGFTLVELIVVIAILGILAGIGTVGYSGYIKKANQAADETLLGAVNTAFAAACIEGGNQWPANAEAKLTEGEKKIQFVKSDIDTEGTVFAKYYKGNESSAFKYYTNLAYDRTLGLFKGATVVKSTNDAGEAVYTCTIDGIKYSVTEAQLQAVQNATYGNMTMNQLAKDVSGMVDALDSALGSGHTIVDALTKGGSTLADWGVTAAPGTDEYKTQLSNAAVLYVAKNTTGETANTLKTAAATMNIEGLINFNDKPGTLVNMGGIYGIMTAFAHSNAAETWRTTVGDKTYNATEYYDYVNQQIANAAASDKRGEDKMTEILAAIDLLTPLAKDSEGNLTSQYAAYANSQLETDVNGYTSAMQAITDNQDAFIAGGALTEGFDSGAIGAALNMLFTSSN